MRLIENFYDEIEAAILAHKYELKLKKDKTWAIVKLSDGIDFYLEVAR
jgi:hypothetical protein